jgi:phage gpG-like protein
MPQIKVKQRARIISPADMRKRIEKGNYKAIHYAGANVWQAAKRGIGQAAPKQTAAGTKAVKAGAIIEFVGGLYRDLTMLNSGKPRAAGKPIKSWGPRRFFYNNVRTAWDNSRKSIVIGPAWAQDIARLHQFGGTVTLTAWRIGVGAARQAYLDRQARSQNGGRDASGKFLKRQETGRKYEYGAIIWSQKGFKNSRNWDKTTITKSARYPARPYMRGAAGVERAITKIREAFRNTLPISGGRAA